MRWDDLFADLEAQWQAELKAESSYEIHELAQAEAAGTTIADRLRARQGNLVTIRLLDGSDRAGVVGQAGAHWCVLAEGSRRHLIPTDAVVVAWTLADTAPPLTAVQQALGLGSALRAVANHGSSVRVDTIAGQFSGYIARVGADHVDLRTSTQVLSLRMSTLLCVSSS